MIRYAPPTHTHPFADLPDTQHTTSPSRTPHTTEYMHEHITHHTWHMSNASVNGATHTYIYIYMRAVNAKWTL